MPFDNSTNKVRKMIVDSFAGGGGASTGIENALGRSPDVAINHSKKALALHAANHPETLHLNSNIWDVDPVEVCKGRDVGLLWASPDCKHFSKAKGGAPKDRNIRDLAWIIVRWARFVKPDVILMENVEEFRTWGPLGEDGQPIKEFEGQTFEDWAQQLRDAGYKLEWRELRGCDYGAPTIRKRFFMVARCDGRKITWPKPTHGNPDSAEVKSGALKPWRVAAECIDFTIPCPSIFLTKEEAREYGKANGCRPPKRPLADNTLARVARGMHRYVLERERPFLVNLTHGGRVEDVAEPIRTITGARRGEKALVAPSLVRHFGASTGQSATRPAPTTTAGGGGKTGLLAPSLMSLKGTARRSSSLTSPHPTVLAGGFHSALIAPVMTYAQHGGRNRDIADPCHTITASKKDNNSLIAPTLIQTGYGERKGQKPRALDILSPMGTLVAGGVKHAPATAFLAQHNKAREGVNPGRPIDAPISTVTATGSQQSLIVPWFAKYYGTGDGALADEPCHTVTVRDRFGHMQADLSIPDFSPEHAQRARQVADLMREHGYWDKREFVTVTIDGTEFVIVDVGMRMLTPRELFNAQGFPSDYVIEGVWADDAEGEWTFEAFTKDQQVSCCGNSVCPDLAEALASETCKHLIEDNALNLLDQASKGVA